MLKASVKSHRNGLEKRRSQNRLRQEPDSVMEIVLGGALISAIFAVLRGISMQGIAIVEVSLASSPKILRIDFTSPVKKLCHFIILKEKGLILSIFYFI